MTTSGVPLVNVGRFDEIESTGAASDFVTWMEQQRSHGPDLLLDRLDIVSGSRVLDLGCGPGIDLTEMASRGAHAVGVDVSTSMVSAARARTADHSASVAVADGVSLPFAAESFDGCLCRAVLVHTPEPEEAVGEISRVLQPGGVVVLSEPDHGSHLTATSETDIYERVLAHRRTQFRNPLVGRRLPDLATAAGLAIVRSWAFPIVHRSLASARASGGPFDVAVQSAVADGAISETEAIRYLHSLEELDQRSAFFFVAMSVAVVAAKPGLA